MKRALSVFFAVFIFCVPFLSFSSAGFTSDKGVQGDNGGYYAVMSVNSDSSPKVFVLDYADVMNDSNEILIRNEAERVAAKTGFNIVVIASDNIGTPKTDAHTVEYADDKYEELCGIDTDGILLLINCDTKYDYISTSGLCINYFSDARIDRIFDDIWDDLVGGNYDQAAYTFVFRVEDYYDMGKANKQHEVGGVEVDFDFFDVVASLSPIFFIAFFIGTAVYAAYSHQYKIQPPTTRNYILDNSLVFDNRSDTFIGNEVRTVYTPRSRSSSHGSSGGHSSTHHSHSGGRHGGGGRHR